MEILEQFARFEAPAKAAWAQVQAFEAPLPDYAMLGGFVVVLFALHRSGRKSVEKVRTVLEEAYRKELLTANRRTHQSRSELRRMELEMERERQRKRRLAREPKRPVGSAAVRKHDEKEPLGVRMRPKRAVPQEAAAKYLKQTPNVDAIIDISSRDNENIFFNGVEK